MQKSYCDKINHKNRIQTLSPKFKNSEVFLNLNMSSSQKILKMSFSVMQVYKTLELDH